MRGGPWARGRPVIDLTCGPWAESALLPVFSSSKGAIGLVAALLVQRGRLDLDEAVASYWPEFGAAGKASVTVRQLLSHQAGLVTVDGGYGGDELLAHDPLAARLAAQRPHWYPGVACGYHGVAGRGVSGRRGLAPGRRRPRRCAAAVVAATA